ncbi:hypothetical protein HPB50_017551 [Hyalomma asiaticum]|uniref:Uncharacterized protein n=1 Tax=Hyalomma asiaticum TaxID=266040 RepID=A0ACB7RUH7_HYAAI|nr:hypothetical protein HPB50_017551 [Hyalomma asiaticum]
MCAATADVAEKKPADAANEDADKADDMFTATFEAAQLFNDDGRQREFAPAAAARAMPGLREQRKTRQFCDVVFRAKDAMETWAHRFVMCSKYSGCYALFTLAKESMNPDHKQSGEWTPPIRAVVSDLEGDMIELLVDYAYQTPLHQHVGAHNVLKVLDLAETLKVWRNGAQFEALTAEEMQKILEDGRLQAPSEVEDTFKAILKWISADVTQRKGYLAKFLTLMRFAGCSVSEFESVIVHPEVRADGDSLKVLNAIHQTLTQPSAEVGDVAGVDMSRKLWLEPRLPRDILFLFGGWTSGATNNMRTYNCRAHKWRVMGNQYTSPRAYHGAAVIDSCIYFVGGFNGRECYHSVVCFDVPLNRWSVKANMAHARCYVSVAVLQASNDISLMASSQGYIYAMGGFDGRMRTNTVERYEVETNQCCHNSSFNARRMAWSAYRSAHVGGFTGRTVLDTVECYDPSTDAWTRIATMSSPRSGVKVVAHKDALYIIGGSNGLIRLSSMEQFDVRRARFSELPSMPYAKSNFAAVALEGSIYVIGGFNGTTTVNLVERYDINAREWYTAPHIDANCSASAAFIVQDVADPGRCRQRMVGGRVEEGRGNERDRRLDIGMCGAGRCLYPADPEDPAVTPRATRAVRGRRATNECAKGTRKLIF